MATKIETNRDYASIEKPYNNFLERSIPYTSPTEMANSTSDANNNQTTNTGTNSTPSNGSVETQPVNNPGSMGDVWIKNFIRSSNWAPKSRGFTIDGQTGYAEFTNVFVSGHIQALTGTVGGWTIGSTALYLDGATDNVSSGMASADYPFYAGKKYANRATAPFRVTQAGVVYATGAIIDGTSTLGGRLGSTLATAIDSAGAFINANLNTSAKTILGSFTFSGSGAIAMNTDANNGLWLSPTGILGKKSGATTFAIDISGNATFAGTLNAAAGTLGAITAGTITGATIRTSTSGERIEISSAVTNQINFYNNTDLIGRIEVTETTGDGSFKLVGPTGAGLTIDTDISGATANYVQLGAGGGVLNSSGTSSNGVVGMYRTSTASEYFHILRSSSTTKVKTDLNILPAGSNTLGDSSNLWSQIRATSLYIVDIVARPSGSGNAYIIFNDPFILRSLPASGEPAVVNGMMYYDITNNRIRACVGSAWKTVTVA